MTVCVKVHILDVPYHADCEYDYYVPSHLAEVSVGSLVIVPFGAANRQQLAVVTAIAESVEYETNKIKHIVALISSGFLLLSVRKCREFKIRRIISSLFVPNGAKTPQSSQKYCARLNRSISALSPKNTLCTSDSLTL